MDEGKNNESKSAKPTSDSPWQFHGDNQSSNLPDPMANRKPLKPVKWTASEFIEHDKTAGWFVVLAASASALAAAVYLLTKDVISVVMIVVAAFAFGVFAARKPRVLDYQVDDSGVKIGPKFYGYGNFKAFAIVNEGAVESVWLMPLRRFMPILTIYFAPDDEQKIIDVLGNFLPVQSHQPDPIDRLMHQLRF